MSDYVHNKVVRLPFPKEIISKCNADDVYDCETYLKELLGELWNCRKKNHFSLTCTDNGYYIDWVYYSTYGEESGDFGFVRLLTQKELNIIKPYFDKLGVVYKDEDLRVVNYCYYNCCEAPDYYNIENSDDADLFLNEV
jgi:hypothetical protein